MIGVRFFFLNTNDVGIGGGIGGGHGGGIGGGIGGGGGGISGSYGPPGKSGPY